MAASSRNVVFEIIWNKIRRERRKRRKIRRIIITLAILRKKFILQVCSTLFLILSFDEAKEVERSCRRYRRNKGWWNMVYRNYDDNRFKRNFRINRDTFNYILNSIRNDITKDEYSECPISPECRLAICLYRLARADYLYTIAELFGLGVSTVHGIISGVCEAITKNLWKTEVESVFPSSKEQFTEKILDMEQFWQFPCCWGAVDGCHLPIQCPAGGKEAQKEYHNFKNFYSIVMMGMVDAKDRFMWVSVGFPGNAHDSVILQSTQLWQDITEDNIIPSMGKMIEGKLVYPLLLGDSAFPFRVWLMKPYGNATLSPQESNFNYRLSRATMVTEREPLDS